MKINQKVCFWLILTSVLAAGCSKLPEVPPLSQTPSTTLTPGQFVWYDLVSLNPEQAKAFYGPLFGWEFEASSKPELYTIVKHEGQPVAGIINLRETKAGVDAHPQWLSYMSVANVDQAISEATEMGATVDVKPFDLPKRGRVATILDNRGAIVVLVTSGSGDPPRTDPVWNRWLWTELWTNDEAASSDFYSSLTGADVVPLALGERGSYTLFKKGERRLSGMTLIPDERITPNWLPYVAVEDPTALEARVEELGGRVLASAERTADNRAAIFTDPSGAAFGVHRWPIDLDNYPEATR
jgi:hypothetical protein